MDDLHQKLMKNNVWYAKWHNKPYHQKAQIALLIGVVSLMTAGLAYRIQTEGKSYGLSSKASGVPKDSDSKQLPFTKGQKLGSKPGEVLVAFKDGTSPTQINEVAGGQGLKLKSELTQIKVNLFTFSSGRTPEVVAEALSHNPNVEFAEPNSIYEPAATVTDPLYGNGKDWNAHYSGWHLDQISAPLAWDKTPGSSSIVMAIVDSGVQPNRQDLAENVIPGWNVRTNTSDNTDNTGHGTAVAGSAAAVTNNGTEVAAVCWHCKIMPVEATLSDTEGSSTTSLLASGINWAADHGAKLVNVSFGFVNGDRTFTRAASYLHNKGGLLTIAAGNSGTLDNSPNDSNIVDVSNSDVGDVMNPSSVTGTAIDFAAPGTQIAVTCLNVLYPPNSCSGTGTSISAPIVLGVAALVWSANPTLTNDQVFNILKQNADDRGPAGYDPQYGWGRINAGRSVAAACAMAGATCGTADITPPSVTIASPTGGTTASGITTLQVNTSDSSGVSKVEYYRVGSFYPNYPIYIGKSATAPFNFNWDSASVANNQYSIMAKAFDTIGNATFSPTISLNTNNSVLHDPPHMVFTPNPININIEEGTHPSYPLTLTNSSNTSGLYWNVTYTGPCSIAGPFAPVAPGTTLQTYFNYNTQPVGTYSCTLTFTDPAADNSPEVVQVNYTVTAAQPPPPPPPDDTTAPTVSLDSPVSGNIAKASTVNITATASDNVGVTQVVLYVNGTAICSDSTAAYSCPWKVPNSPKKTYQLQAKAYDAKGNVGSSNIVTVTSQ